MSISDLSYILKGMTPVEIRLREVRKSVGFTQAQLARKAGMAQGEISRIESSATMISLDVLDRLCRALKCEPGDILVRKRR